MHGRLLLFILMIDVRAAMFNKKFSRLIFSSTCGIVERSLPIFINSVSVRVKLLNKAAYNLSVTFPCCIE
jgi:hypothetical protein